ncbi:probable disease resistance protein At4g27220 [Chenopodium quinoa]|uniref:probable disease resistance protein At4g27220 n=1 Tax=Chenopodium quinoa TaxID=63459 RepID=UPI000B76FEFC|nr:probable disease resistance protein At4g27220 [Chenopodium quinoa]
MTSMQAKIRAKIALMTCEKYETIRRYDENMKKLKEELIQLNRRNDNINYILEYFRGETRMPSDYTIKWLKDVKDLLENDEELMKLMKEIDDEDQESSRNRQSNDHCFGDGGRVCSLKQRYEASLKAKEMAARVEPTVKNFPGQDVSTRIFRPLYIKEIEEKGYKEYPVKKLDFRNENLVQVVSKLKEVQIDAIGMFGDDGVGKTTLAKEIANKGANGMLFEKIVMVEVSRTPNVEHIQDQIAEQLNLKLSSLHSTEQRAEDLLISLKKITKILFILDNLCEKIDLGKVGIPQPYHKTTQQFCCKMERVVVNVNDGLKEQEEAAEKRMLNECGGLPLAIVALAYVLKGQELSTWEHFATELEKPISISQAKISGVNPQTYSILQTSYKFMESEEKRKFFLLACLFPSGASIPVEEMMRYGIGLGLFQQVDNLIEAMELANKWVDELKSSALLLEDHRQGYAKIHDLVRTSTISLAEKDGDKVMVEAFPEWPSLETFQEFYAVSLMSGIDHSRMNDLNSDKLQILILDKSIPRGQFSDSFFDGMLNLKVLVLKGMDFTLGLPNSIRKLKKNLRTLLLEKCKLGDITGIDELTNLVVLSLRESSMEELPEAIGNLCNLRLLDLNGCAISKKGISANVVVLSKLSKLEGLYALSNGLVFDYEEGENRSEFAIDELDEVQVTFEDCPINNELEFVKKLDQFQICVGRRTSSDSSMYSQSRALLLSHIKNPNSVAIYKSVRVLREKIQVLIVKFMWELQHVFDDHIHQQEDEPKMQSSILTFPHLQHLMVRLCPKMQSISSIPFVAPELAEVTVSSCDSMRFIFMEHERQENEDEDVFIKRFSSLKRMSLEYLSKLESLTMIFPSLEQLVLYCCGRIVTLFDVSCTWKNIYRSSFKNLHKLEITRCDKLETLGSLSIATALVQLKQLSIDRCPQLREVISHEEDEEIRGLTFGYEFLPLLESVRLKDCPKLKMFISGAKLKDKFPILLLLTLQKLDISKCPEMKFFSLGPSFKAPKLNHIDFDYVATPMDNETKEINFLFES